VTQPLGALLVAALTATTLVGLSIPVLRRWHVMDAASVRSSHVGEVPRGGGVAVAVAVILACAATGADRAVIVPVVCFTLPLALLGSVDDVRPLSPEIRLLAQLAAATGLLVSFTVTGVEPLHASPPLLRAVAVVVGVGLVLWVVNAVNFMDGINGISALTAMVCGGWYLLLGVQHDQQLLSVLGAALLGASAGFLPWNAPRARVFLGDSGSYFIGAVAALLATGAWAGGRGVLAATAPLLIYLADVGVTLVRRIAHGDAWRQPHRLHVYQRVLDHRRWPHLAVALLVAAASSLCCLLVAVLPVTLAVVGCAVVVVGYLSLPRLLGCGSSARGGRVRT
jgi:UDP-GlcNAc:undecaprenyl-phosphate GlcNAc-1-phosphate transferase